MMAKRIFRGDAPTAKQITRIKAPLDDGAIVLRVGNKSLTFDSWDAAAIASGWNAATWPEFREAIASSSGTDLYLTARTAGVPFFVVLTVGDSGPGTGRNETQLITLVNGADGGTFQAEFDGDATDIDWNVDGAGFQTALEGLDSIETGDITVTGAAGGPWTVTFGGRFAGQNVPAIVVGGANLTGGNALVQIETIQDGGGSGTPATVSVDVLQFHYGFITYDSTNSVVQSSSYADIDMKFGGDESSGIQRHYHPVMKFLVDVPRGATITAATLSFDWDSFHGAPQGTLYAEAADDAADVVLNDPEIMTRPLTTASAAVSLPSGASTPAINVAAILQEVIDRPGWEPGNAVQLHLRAASNNAWGHIMESGFYESGPFLSVTYTETLREIQTIALLGSSIRSGGVLLTLDDQTATELPHDATAGAAQSAVAALANVGSGNVQCSGGPWPGQIVFSFAGSLGNLPQLTATHDLVNGDVQNSTTAQGGPDVEIIETARSRGPNHWDDALNWENETGAFGVPQDGDAVYCPDGRVDLLYGLLQRCRFTADAGTDRLFLTDGQCALRDGQAVSVQSANALPGGLAAETTYYVRDFDPSGPSLRLAATAGGVPVAITSTGTGPHEIGVRLTLLETDARYAGKLGLPRRNAAGFAEYRPRFLTAWVERALIGTGNGTGSQRCHLHAGASPITLQLRTSGGGTDNAPAVQLLCSGAGNTVEVLAGQLGLAIDPEQSGEIESLLVRSGQVLIGRDVALGDIERTGGSVVSLGATMDGKLVL